MIGLRKIYSTHNNIGVIGKKVLMKTALNSESESCFIHKQNHDNYIPCNEFHIACHTFCYFRSVL